MFKTQLGKDEVVPYIPLEVYSTMQINWDTYDSRRHFCVVSPTQCLIMLINNVQRHYIMSRRQWKLVT